MAKQRPSLGGRITTLPPFVYNLLNVAVASRLAFA